MAQEDRKIIIVTGATSGIGLALIYRLKDAGYLPVMTGRNADKVADLSQKAGVPGYQLDVADEDHIRTIVAQIKVDHGPVCAQNNQRLFRQQMGHSRIYGMFRGRMCAEGRAGHGLLSRQGEFQHV